MKLLTRGIYNLCTGLCPDWQDWKSQNALQNAKEAMNLADDWLDVKQVSGENLLYVFFSSGTNFYYYYGSEFTNMKVGNKYQNIPHYKILQSALTLERVFFLC